MSSPVSAPVDAAADSGVLKPDFGSRRKHFIFNDFHEDLRESIEAFVVKELAPHAEEWEETTFPDWVFTRMGELGFLGLSYPEEYGGQGGDYMASIVLAEELVHSARAAWRWASRCTRTWPPRRSTCSARRSRSSATSCRRSRAEDRVARDHGARRGSDVAGIKTRAVRDGDEWVINGSKTYITNGHRSDYIVLGHEDRPRRGLRRLHAVPRRHGPARRGPRAAPAEARMHASDTALLAFQDVRVPHDAVLGEVGKGFYHIMWELQGERLIGAAGCVAGAQQAFDKTLQYAMERKAFGRQIGKFQVIRHKFAEMATKIESARQMVYTTAWRFANGEYPVREISMAKLHAARIAVEVADECIQIHGGAGYMKEYGIERTWRDMRLNRIGAGTDEIMLDVIGRSYGL
jgi:alkylation response protein AidB-like acyl-CoA dehydrogenase